MKSAFLLSIAAAACLAGCAGNDASRGEDPEGTRLTVGNVQRNITKGMTGGQVAEALGSPNIVSTDENGMEVWIYDRFASEVRAAQSSVGWWLVLAGGSQSSASARSSQRSLTVIVKFDQDKLVRDVAYHSSSF